jgi:hypothetical protein
VDLSVSAVLVLLGSPALAMVPWFAIAVARG